jgi:cytochrome c-type biogenesis protein CcmH
MTLFWILAAVLVAATLATLLWPLLRRATIIDAPDAERAALAVFRDQKRALDAEQAAGTIGSGEYEAALAELTRRVAEESGAALPSAARVHQPRAWPVALLVAAVVPVAALLLYQRLGNPGATAVAAVAAGHDVTEQQVTAMVEGLAQRLKQRPDDADGWVLLARSYQALDRFPESADAYAHAAALIKDDANLLADYADALAMAQGRKLAGQPAALIERALAIDPKQKKALALAATVALEASDTSAALAYWRRLAAELPPGSEEARQVAGFIADISTQGQGKVANAPSTPRPVATVPGNAAPAKASAQSSAGAVSGRVDLAPTLAAKVALSDTVFIFARAAEGSRMPLAVLRIPARELPKDFRLDDSMSMAPGVKLSTTPTVVVEARISKSGGALPQAGDLFGRTAPVKPGAADLRIVIDQVVP